MAVQIPWASLLLYAIPNFWFPCTRGARCWRLRRYCLYTVRVSKPPLYKLWTNHGLPRRTANPLRRAGNFPSRYSTRGESRDWVLERRSRREIRSFRRFGAKRVGGQAVRTRTVNVPRRCDRFFGFLDARSARRWPRLIMIVRRKVAAFRNANKTLLVFAVYASQLVLGESRPFPRNFFRIYRNVGTLYEFVHR